MPGAIGRRFAPYLLTLVMPLSALLYTLTGPHEWYWAIALWLTMGVHVHLDRRGKPAREQPVEGEPGWLYTGLLVTLAGLQLLNVFLLVRLFAGADLWSINGVVDFYVGASLVGVSSGLSGIVVAHELMHRPQKGLQFLSRLVMGSVLYEHFFTEHVRGHHVRVGTPEDPATARFGERFEPFFRRTVPAQFRSAWSIEMTRNDLEGKSAWHPAQLRNRVLQGVLCELLCAGAIGYAFGPVALLVFCAQAIWAIRLLEAVNYFEHWGIQRQGRKVRPADSWDTESSFTRYGLVGLSRHADHHAYASRPYQRLRHFDESAKYPGGYLSMVVLVLSRNRRFIRLATSQLKARKLGPFAEPKGA